MLSTKKASRTVTSDARFRQLLSCYKAAVEAQATYAADPESQDKRQKEARAITLLEVSVIEWLNDVLKT